ncbi:MAG: bifunctional oligoribonuclease/PAP phosphatase NrnA [Treponema sp.]|jgi:phosphoesterase RecJ-like protein|nr:bifunctional oligoribonuclease/PAP phosphatase NrnA [Treponema sp.]
MYKPEPVPQELLRFIQGGHKFLIAGHKEPDGDCIGSQLALSSLLQRLGKETLACSAGPFKRTEIIPYEHLFLKRPGPAERQGSRLIIVDCSGLDRTGDLEEAIGGLPTAIIDHHATGNQGPETADRVLYVDRNAPAASFMIQALIETLGLSPSREEAELLLFGLCTDTGFFRHVNDEGAEVFAFASRLIQAGANPKQAFQAMHGGKSLGSRILMGRILSRLESHYNGKLIVSTEPYEESQCFGMEGRDSDALYQLLQSIAGVEAVAIIRQETLETCTIGLRSREAADVSAIAAQFGGGGHKNAAGAQIKGLIQTIKPKVIEAFLCPLERLS